ncbi:MAG: hypothetical protein DRP63_04865 [Planctomycetota bacterium]|nr:MAG: hypothetical protein DRP63_04865 [Planctomycetota bacterium]
MARIYRRGDVWYVDYANMDGQRVRRAVGRNKRLAEEVLRPAEMRRMIEAADPWFHDVLVSCTFKCET